MQIPEKLRLRLLAWAIKTIRAREPDKLISPDSSGPIYMKRWYVIPKNWFFNIYLHHFMHSDDERALHTHPWFNCSILIHGDYIEWMRAGYLTISGTGANPIAKQINGAIRRRQGFIYFRPPWRAHRVELIKKIISDDDGASTPITITKGVITIFITGPIVQRWGFLCPQGFRHWKEFTGGNKKHSTIGRGCE